MKHIQITWLDSHAWSGGWMTSEEALGKIRGAEPVKSTGYVVDEDENYISIAQNVTDGNVSMLYKIPKGSIKEIKEI